MGGFSDYLEKAILNATLRNIAFPAANASVYLALFSSDPLDDGSGTELTAGTAVGYARVQILAAGWSAPAASTPSTASTVSNLANINFAPCGGDWPVVTHFALFDVAVAGNMLYHGALTTPLTFINGDTCRFAAGTLAAGAN